MSEPFSSTVALFAFHSMAALFSADKLPLLLIDHCDSGRIIQETDVRDSSFTKYKYLNCSLDYAKDHYVLNGEVVRNANIIQSYELTTQENDYALTLKGFDLLYKTNGYAVHFTTLKPMLAKVAGYDIFFFDQLNLIYSLQTDPYNSNLHVKIYGSYSGKYFDQDKQTPINANISEPIDFNKEHKDEKGILNTVFDGNQDQLVLENDYVFDTSTHTNYHFSSELNNLYQYQLKINQSPKEEHWYNFKFN